MPVVFRHQGLRFHFYSNEGDPREPMHVHVRSGDRDAKLWLYPEPSVAYNAGFSARDLGELMRLARFRRADIERAWNEHFS